MYQKRTLRRMSPWTRELAKRTNEAELHFRRMKKLTDESYASDRKLLDMNSEAGGVGQRARRHRGQAHQRRFLAG